MDGFIKIDKLGIEYNCYVVATTNYDGNDYIICTDFISDKNNDIRLFVVKFINNNLVSIPYEESKKIIDDFKIENEKYLNEVWS